jgi:glyoxylase-like metal-dependent hydrolase (beta-lactamase superfamily II)
MNLKDIGVYLEHSSISYRQNLFSKIPQLKAIPQEEYKIVSQQSFLPLVDGQVFHLGGISIKVIGVPGHTQGMMMALIPEEEIILFGDACGVSVLLFEDCSSTVSDYKKALLRLKKEYSSCYKRVIRNHGSFESPVAILDNVISCCDDILSKKDDHVETEVFGQKGYFIAKKVNGKGERLDGEQGNIIYRFDKAM